MKHLYAIKQYVEGVYNIVKAQARKEELDREMALQEEKKNADNLEDLRRQVRELEEEQKEKEEKEEKEDKEKQLEKAVVEKLLQKEEDKKDDSPSDAQLTPFGDKYDDFFKEDDGDKGHVKTFAEIQEEIKKRKQNKK